MSVYVGDRRVCRTCTLDGHLQRVTYTRCRINTIDSPDDEHRDAGNIFRIIINIYEKIVRQIGYLQELNRYARSTEHKSLFSTLDWHWSLVNELKLCWLLASVNRHVETEGFFTLLMKVICHVGCKFS
jgi:hypothetical protein